MKANKPSSLSTDVFYHNMLAEKVKHFLRIIQLKSAKCMALGSNLHIEEDTVLVQVCHLR